MQNTVLRSIALAAGLSATVLLYGQSLTWLGVLEGDDYSYATGVSQDGAAVSGMSAYYDQGLQTWRVRGFRWTPSDGLQSLEHPDGSTYAYGISGSGSIIVGGLSVLTEARALYWDGLDLYTLSSLGGTYGMAHDASRDGGIIVGQWTTGDGFPRAVKWEYGSISDLGTLGGAESGAYGVSTDGSVIVGWAENRDRTHRAARWTRSGVQDLGTPTSWPQSFATRASQTGDFIVGTGESDSGRKVAFRWSVSGVQDLGTLGGDHAMGYDISGDGSIVVGYTETSDNRGVAFRWTAAGMEDLNTTYAFLLVDGSQLIEARGISDDGRFIVGMGLNATTGRTEAFLLDTACTGHDGDVDGNGCVDDADLLAILFSFGQTGQNLGRVDVNCDETVDDADLLMVLFNFGSGC